jgi:hypothetical protein
VHHYKSYKIRENLHHPAIIWRIAVNSGYVFGEIHLKSDIYRHKLYMIKEQFPLPLCTSKQGVIACHHLRSLRRHENG